MTSITLGRMLLRMAHFRRCCALRSSPPSRPLGLMALAIVAIFPEPSLPAAPQLGPRVEIQVARVTEPPQLEDFLDMKPRPEWEGRLTRVGDFIQYLPNDGAPATQPSEAYFGYDDDHFYAVIVCFDSEPEKIRARLARREKINEDDFVVLVLDTFHDQRRGYQFWSNPLGIQADNIWTEGRGLDFSFDTVWHSRAKITDRGYVVWMAIPFKSLRFKPAAEQTWGIAVWRIIPRLSEESTWPRISSRIEGELNQSATIHGLRDISPGRNIQLVPYAFMRSFRALDTLDPEGPRFVSDNFDPQAGLDAKLILKDSFVLDVAVNPDFSQVESDEPQITLNRRFEVFFPEKRPFFIENAGFFQTPINLFFTRRIADPQWGVRLTGKRGPYAVGVLLADDEAPGKVVPSSDPLFGKRAHVGVVRVERDIFKQSAVGFIFTNRELAGGFNRVGGLDTRLKLSDNWVATLQGVTSSTQRLDGSRLAGPAYKGRIRRTGRHFFYSLDYDDRSPGFFTETGFLAEGQLSSPLFRSRTITAPSLRTDMRNIRQYASYLFRPESKSVISWGPALLLQRAWDYDGTPLHKFHDASFRLELPGFTYLEAFQTADRERLRPQDFSLLPENRSFSHRRNGLYVGSQALSGMNFSAEFSRGTGINFVPADGRTPFLTRLDRASLGLVLRPWTPLRIENSYLLERLRDRSSGASVFNNHIVRSNWNWQFNREFSLRVILRYDAVHSNRQLTSLETTRNFNADFLFTYLVNPWTALYVGYNGNLQNIELLTTPGGRELTRTSGFLNDARQFFVKFSYLVRF